MLTKIERDRLLDYTNEVSAYFLKQYEEVRREIPIVSEIRGIGLLLCIELSHDVTYESMLEIEKNLFEHGYIVGVKPNERVIRTYCPLIVTVEMIREYIAALKHILRNLH